MEHINDCTEMRVHSHRVLKKDWTITVAELRSFLGILYTRGAYEARSLKASERLQIDKFALISEIWNRFISIRLSHKFVPFFEWLYMLRLFTYLSVS